MTSEPATLRGDRGFRRQTARKTVHAGRPPAGGKPCRGRKGGRQRLEQREAEGKGLQREKKNLRSKVSPSSPQPSFGGTTARPENRRKEMPGKKRCVDRSHHNVQQDTSQEQNDAKVREGKRKSRKMMDGADQTEEFCYSFLADG